MELAFPLSSRLCWRLVPRGGGDISRGSTPNIRLSPETESTHTQGRAGWFTTPHYLAGAEGLGAGFLQMAFLLYARIELGCVR
jgi:hypothetical protein